MPNRAWQILAGASTLWGPGGDAQALPWMFAPSLGLEWRMLSAWALELRVVAPAFGGAGSSDDATDVDQELALLGAGWRERLGSLVRVTASAGPGLYRIGVRGQQPVPPPPDNRPPPRGGEPARPGDTYRDYSNTYWYACAYGGAGLELYPGSRATVRVLGDIVVPMDRAEIGLANRQSAKSGVPILLATVGLALKL